MGRDSNPRGAKPLPVFKTGAFDHSATHPKTTLAKCSPPVSQILSLNLMSKLRLAS